MNQPKKSLHSLEVIPNWVISDTHFCHGNIRVYEEWRTLWSEGTSDMNRKMIEAWNDVVGDHDVVLHVGDFALGKRSVIAKLRSKLKGYIIIIRGNHDPSHKVLGEAGFDESYNGVEFDLDGLMCYVRHSPHDFTGEEVEKDGVLVHGHLHGSGNYNMSHPLVGERALLGTCFDLSLDAIESVGPVPISSIKGNYESKVKEW